MNIVYFMSKGEASYVLPQCENMPYVVIEEGDMFGTLDLVPANKETVIDREIQRQFTVMALDYCDVLCLSLEVNRRLLKFCSIYRRSTKSTHRSSRRSSSRRGSGLGRQFACAKKPSNSTSKSTRGWEASTTQPKI